MRKTHASGRPADSSAGSSLEPNGESAYLEASVRNFIATRPHLSQELIKEIGEMLSPPYG